MQRLPFCFIIIILLVFFAMANEASSQQKTCSVNVEINIPYTVSRNSIFSNKIVDVWVGSNSQRTTFKLPNLGLIGQDRYKRSLLSPRVAVDKNNKASVTVGFQGKTYKTTVTIHNGGKILVQPTYNWDKTKLTGWRVSSSRR
jgi:hypothetical protein